MDKIIPYDKKITTQIKRNEITDGHFMDGLEVLNFIIIYFTIKLLKVRF